VPKQDHPSDATVKLGDRMTSDRLRLASAENAITYYWLTTAAVFLGLALGQMFGQPPSGFLHLYHYDPSECYANWDGQWYKEIAAEGYSYDPNTQSSVAFFPAFPLFGRIAAALTGLDVAVALVFIANLCLVFSFALLYRYLHITNPGLGERQAGYSLLCLGLLPNTFYFRMAYSESPLLLLTLATLYAMERRWPLLLIAAIIGLATATRPIGIGLIPGFALHVCSRTLGTGRRVLLLAALLPLACWGIMIYVAYLGWRFGNPTVFIQTQVHWSSKPALSFSEKALYLAQLRPFWSMLDPASPGFLGGISPLTIRFADPFFFAGAMALTAVGVAKGWVTLQNALCAAFYLQIPYLTKGYEYDLGGMGRFASLALPGYIVLGRLLDRIPTPIAAGFFGICGSMIGVYVAMFASWR
jgi:hypothetical protein